jgi:glycine betaine/choline ABC-type transport system substrate-binding protein
MRIAASSSGTVKQGSLAQEVTGKYLDAVAAKLIDSVMQKLNAKVDADGYEPKTVAHDWLKEQEFLK